MNAADNRIGTMIDEQPLTKWQISIMVLCGSVILLDGFDLQTMPLAVPSLTTEWHLESAAFTFALSADPTPGRPLANGSRAQPG